ncbi:MAG: hypothetical protein B7X10_00435, partial [Burkholderiales bacterium 21-58-4]
MQNLNPYADAADNTAPANTPDSVAAITPMLPELGWRVSANKALRFAVHLADEKKLAQVASSLTFTTAPFSLGGGSGAGGDITGLAAIGNNLYAVTDAGGLYQVLNYNGGGSDPSPASLVSVATIVDPTTGQPIAFHGLTAGPPDVENGAYANTLFATSESGVLYAINLNNFNVSRVPGPTLTGAVAETSGGSLAANTYYYVITAITAGGQSLPGSESAATVTTNNGSVELSWAPVLGASGYDIYRGTVTGAEEALVGTVIGNATTSFVDTGTPFAAPPPATNTATVPAPVQKAPVPGSGGILTAGTYHYEITATTAAGETTASNEQPVVVGASGEVMLSWTAVAGATGYNVYRSTSSSFTPGPGTVLATQVVGGGTTSALDPGSGNPGSPPPTNTATILDPTQAAPTTSATGGSLSAGTYYYEVTALTANGQTTANSERSVLVAGPNGQVTVTWAFVQGATGYNIYRGSTSGGENVLVGSVPSGAVTSFVDLGGPLQESPPTGLDAVFHNPGDANANQRDYSVTLPGVGAGSSLYNNISLAFSTLDYNLWHVTDSRSGNAGHGIIAAPDVSRTANTPNPPSPASGNESFYFGMDDPRAS